MRNAWLALAAWTLAVGAGAHGQEIVEVPAKEAGVVLPEDVFGLPAGQWFLGKQVTRGNDPCTAEACEAAIHSGDVVVNVEHARPFVRVIAGFRGCERVAYQEVEVGTAPGGRQRRQVSDLIKYVVKGAEKSCSRKAPRLPKLDVKSLLPKTGS